MDGEPNLIFKLKSIKNLDSCVSCDLTIRNAIVNHDKVMLGGVSGGPLAEQRLILGREGYNRIILYDY